MMARADATPRIEYTACADTDGRFVPRSNKRRCAVVKWVDGKFAYVCSAHANMQTAQGRANELNRTAAKFRCVPAGSAQ